MEHRFDHNYDGTTVITPFGLVLLVCLGGAILVLPRRFTLWPVVIMGSFMSPAQRIVLLSLNFDMVRLIVFVGICRVLFRKEWRGLIFTKFDWLVLAFSVASFVVYVLQYQSVESAKAELGVAYDALGTYFLFRCLIIDFRDIKSIAECFGVISIPVAAAFLIEWSTGHNLFAVFGGLPTTTAIREGRLRCQGAYAHPIIAGCYWSGVLPIIAALWWRGGRDRWVAVTGISCGLLIVILTASGTPASAVLVGIVGGFAFYLRRKMRLIRRLAVLLLLTCQLFMKAPVWSIVDRIDLVGGSTGWHRVNIINQFTTHFSDWWLLGASDVESWGIWAGDITNQYFFEAARGGLLALYLFISVIITAFSIVGRSWRKKFRNPADLAMSWAIGVSLFVHCVSFIGISYFGQVKTLWFLHLAIVGGMGAALRSPNGVVTLIRGPKLWPSAPLAAAVPVARVQEI